MKIRGPEIKPHVKKFVVEPEKRLDLGSYDTGWAQHNALKERDADGAREHLVEMLAKDRTKLAKVQEVLAASRKYAVLILLQGMDTAGKDGTIRHVMSGINPQGCEVHSFKVPNNEELSHDFLWRYSRALPERGTIGLFNRSYYEDVLVVRVHPERLEPLPREIGPQSRGFWKARFRDIRGFERHLVQNGTLVLKFFLHISRDEQKLRLIERLTNPEKYWKFSQGDIEERRYWTAYREAYEEMLPATSTEYAPWFVIPADYKWAARTFVAEVIISAIDGLHLTYPKMADDQMEHLMAVKKDLESE